MYFTWLLNKAGGLGIARLCLVFLPLSKQVVVKSHSLSHTGKSRCGPFDDLPELRSTCHKHWYEHSTYKDYNLWSALKHMG